MERKIIVSDITFTYTEKVDKKLVEILSTKVLDGFSKAREFFKEYVGNLEVNICTKQELNKIVVKYTNVYGDENSIPNWLTGFSVNHKVYVVILSEKDLEYMVKVVVHELVHLLSDRIEHKERRPKLLQEGLAVYLSGQMSEKRFKAIVNDYTNNKLHKLSEYINCNGLEFANLNGYNYSYFAMEYFFNKYGKEKILCFLEQPEEFDLLVNTEETDFEEYLIGIINKDNYR